VGEPEPEGMNEPVISDVLVVLPAWYAVFLVESTCRMRHDEVKLHFDRCMSQGSVKSITMTVPGTLNTAVNCLNNSCVVASLISRVLVDVNFSDSKNSGIIKVLS